MGQRKGRSFDFEALADFRYEIRRFLNFSQQGARAAGIEPHQHQALLVIKGLRHDAKPTVGLLAERLQIRHHSAVELSDRLESQGLIRRSRSAADRREVLLALTPRGEKLLQRLTLSHHTELRTVGPSLLRALEAVIGHEKRSRRSRRRAKGNR